MEISNELFEIFIQETSEHLEILDESLLILEKDNDNKDQIDKVFRSFHTIKGSTAFMGYGKVAEFVHHIEDLIQDVRESKIKLTSEMCNHLLKCQGFLARYIGDVSKGREENLEGVEELLAVVDKIRSGESLENINLEVIQTQLAEVETTEIHVSDREDTAVFKVCLDPESGFKTIRTWMIFNEAASSGELIWSDPPKPTDDDFANGFFNVTQTEIQLELVPSIDPLEIQHLFESIVEVTKVEIIKQPKVEALKNTTYTLSFETPIERDLKYYTFLSEQIALSKKALDAFIGNLDDTSVVWDLYRYMHTIKGIMGYVGETKYFSLVAQIEKLLKKLREFEVSERINILGIIANSLELLESVFLDIQQGNAAAYEKETSSLSEFMTMILGQVKSEDKVVSSDALSIISPPLADVVQPVNKESTKTADKPNVIDSDQVEPKDEPKLEAKIEATTATEKSQTSATPKVETTTAPKIEAKLQSYIRIPEIKVDNLVDLLGELLILQSLHRQDVTLLSTGGSELENKVVNNLMRMERITKEIQTIAMSLRMVSLKQTLQKLQRIGHDTAVGLKKQIVTEIFGEDTEIDRSIVEKIQDPLMHLVRNSISHGIESESDRAAKGKPTVGTVKISAYNKRGNVYIEVWDDGKGLNPANIHKKAIEKGLIDADGSYTEEEILRFIYLPGFSTAENIDNISGRGVGMNVVETEIVKIGGRIEINNNEGQSCAFILKIPVNLATINGTVVEIGNSKFIIPTMHVKHILKPVEDQFVIVKNRKKMITVRQETIQIIELDKVLNYEAAEADAILNNGLIVVIEVDQKMKALPVNSVIGKQEVVLKPLGPEFRHYSFLSGATILGDGTVSLILEIETIFKLSEDQFKL